jgi:hypothetical protein
MKAATLKAYDSFEWIEVFQPQINDEQVGVGSNPGFTNPVSISVLKDNPAAHLKILLDRSN